MSKRPPLIVYIDALGAGLSESIAEAAAARGIATAVICPPGEMRGRRQFVWRVIRTRDFSLDNLRRLVAAIERSHSIRGFYSLFGPFRRDAFLHGHVATLAAERGLSHSPPSALAAATNKFFARYCIGAAGVPDVPFGLAFEEAAALSVARGIGYPVVLKPLTGVGSSLIFKCRNDAELRRFWHKARRELPRAHYAQLRMAPHSIAAPCGAVFTFDPARMMLVERYLPGREASVECIVVGDNVTPLVVHDKLDVEEITGSVLEHLLVAPPLRFTPREVKALRSHAAAAIRALGLRNTLCHVELRWVDGEGPRILEINPRVGAGCVADSIATFTNVDADAARLSLILGERPPPVRRRKAPRHAMVFLFTPRSGTITRLEGLEAVNDWDDTAVVRVMQEVGNRVGGDLEEGFVASIWLEAKNEKQARQAYARIRRRVRIVVR